MGSLRKPSGSVLEKRQTVSAAFALTVRELTAAGYASRHAIADELNRRKVPTQRGGRWHYTSVVRMLTRLGMDNPPYGEPGAGAANRWAALVRAQTLVPIIRQLQSSNIVALRAIARELNARGIPAARGGKWHPASVDRLLRRLRRPAATPKLSRNIQAPWVPRSRAATSPLKLILFFTDLDETARQLDRLQRALEEARPIVDDERLNEEQRRVNLRKTLKAATSAIWASHHSGGKPPTCPIR
ncbi:Recombinase [Rhodospirillales bacterium URHD0017]|nr:Recombinase [Rhodospirillales bacterium URHD0017]